MAMPHSSTNPAETSNPIHNLQIGYCTNVHAGHDLQAVVQNIREFCVPIRELACPKAPLGVGLWFSEKSVREAILPQNLEMLKNLLREGQLVPFTLNGFPQGDFHSEVVKHRVYLPTWWQQERLDYTRMLVHVLDGLLPAGQTGSISTLPIAWGYPKVDDSNLKQAASNLMILARELHQRFEETGRKILIAIEPEPGCCLTDTASFLQFYLTYLSSPALSEKDAAIARTYLTLCHDVCHAAVMFEDQAAEFQKLHQAGIEIGKVQVSSAVQVDWESLSLSKKCEAMQQLKAFAEDRYLHQTTSAVLSHNSVERNIAFVEDLPDAIGDSLSPENLSGVWRVHFHVPIYLSEFGNLLSTQSEITKCIELLMKNRSAVPKFSGHFEIETYAWGVLPAELRATSLQRGIANEIGWFTNLLHYRD